MPCPAYVLRGKRRDPVQTTTFRGRFMPTTWTLRLLQRTFWSSTKNQQFVTKKKNLVLNVKVMFIAINNRFGKNAWQYEVIFTFQMVKLLCTVDNKHTIWYHYDRPCAFHILATIVEEDKNPWVSTPNAAFWNWKSGSVAVTEGTLGPLTG